MDIDTYQEKAVSTAIYEHDGEIPFLALGLCGEAGEVADKVKKVLRDKGGEFDAGVRHSIAFELGDCLYYLANLASAIGYPLSEIAELNNRKVEDRMERDVIHGFGDER